MSFSAGRAGPPCASDGLGLVGALARKLILGGRGRFVPRSEASQAKLAGDDVPLDVGGPGVDAAADGVPHVALDPGL